jgi:hypothetical protein
MQAVLVPKSAHLYAGLTVQHEEPRTLGLDIRIIRLNLYWIPKPRILHGFMALAAAWVDTIILAGLLAAPIAHKSHLSQQGAHGTQFSLGGLVCPPMTEKVSSATKWDN